MSANCFPEAEAPGPLGSPRLVDYDSPPQKKILAPLLCLSKRKSYSGIFTQVKVKSTCIHESLLYN